MKRIVKALLAAQAVMLLMSGCGADSDTAPASAEGSLAQEEVTVEASEAAETTEAVQETDDGSTASAAEAAAADASGGVYSSYDDPAALPAYKYQGTDKYLDVISDYLIELELESRGDDLPDVFIPFSIIVQTDESDPQAVTVYGSFNMDGYDLRNTTLESVTSSRGNGAIHLKKKDDGSFEVTEAELPVVDEEEPEVFASVPGLYEKVKALSEDELNAAHEQAIAEYINSNGLNITQWQDYGKPPVPVINAPETPEEAEFHVYESPLGYTMTYDLRELTLAASPDYDMYGRIEDTYTGTFMDIEKSSGADAEAAIKQVLNGSEAAMGDITDATINGIKCSRTELDDKLEDGRIFRYVCYAVPAEDGVITILLETTCEKGVSELSVAELEKIFEGALATFSV